MTHEHRWVVYSTAIADVVIMVYCEGCTVKGYIENFTSDEWQQAFFAPSNPYYWEDNNRVIIYGFQREIPNNGN